MYLTSIKTLFTTAMQQVFNQSYIDPAFQDLYISIEYPVDRTNYPGVWVDFEPEGDLASTSIDRYMQPPVVEDLNNGQPYQLFYYAGYVTFTAVSLSSLQRDLLVDELIRIMAFPTDNPGTNTYRQNIENNEYIACTANWDKIGQRGFAATPGTPWGSNEVIYEATLAQECIGQFMVTPNQQFIKLTQLIVAPTVESTPLTSFVTPPVAPNFLITTDSLPSAVTGQIYNQTLTASGGIGPYFWTLPAGSVLPYGMTLSNAGVLSGTAAVTKGVYPFIVEAHDSTQPNPAFALTQLTISVT